MHDSPLPEAAIFDAALQLPPEQRAKHLDLACGDDAALRQRIEALLEALERSSGFLDQPGSAPGSKTLLVACPASEQPGDIIGSYKLLQQIGEGGCGVVYMAEQEKPVQRRVALKVIKLGMDTKSVIARFEAERQALALMDHPNIAKVLEAGATNAGRPYFVMELVRGVKITDYCDHNNLTTTGRLDLFMQVCRAIQHAHQKGIIHRDIKPSNILVTLHDGTPVPKVIDFGIAKATQGRLTDRTVFTAFEQFLGTPAYTSPEQAEMSGLDIDTRSDIYSLGVLLYELLTGKTPFETRDLLAAGLEEMRRMIREREPDRPSLRLSTMLEAELTITATRRQTQPPRLITSLRGDLDWIVMKCLEKDRTRRYETSNGLAMDIQRHLDNEPILARPASAAYQLRKLVGRNKLACLATAAVAAALIIGLGLATWQYRHAVASERKSRSAADFFEKMLASVGPSHALGRDPTMVRDMLDKTAEHLGEDLRDQPEVEAELRSTIGQVYFELDELAPAEAMQRKALELRRRALGEESLPVAASRNDLTQVLWQKGSLPEAEAEERKALAIRRKLLPADHPDVANSLNNLGVVLRDQQKFEQAEPMLRNALATQKRIFPGDHERLAETLTALSSLLWSTGRMEEAERLNRDALAMYRRLRSKDDPELANALNNLGTLLRAEGKLPAAKEALSEALAIGRKTLPPGHQWLARTICNLAGVLYDSGDQSQAEALYREVLPITARHYGTNSAEVADVLNNLGTVLRSKEDFGAAETVLVQAVAIGRGVFTNDNQFLATAIYNLAGVLWDEAKNPEAERMYKEAVAMLTRLQAEARRPEVALTLKKQLALTLNNLGTALREQNKLTEAEIAHRQALDIQREIHDEANMVGSFNNLGTVLKLQHRLDEAETMSREAVAAMKKLAGDGSQFLFFPLGNLVHLLIEQGQLAQAEEAARELLGICQKQFPDDWRLFDTQSLVGGILTLRGQYAAAEPLLLSGYLGLQQREKKLPPRLSSRLKRAGERIVELYEALGSPGKAAEWKKKVIEFNKTEAEKNPPVHP